MKHEHLLKRGMVRERGLKLVKFPIALMRKFQLKGVLEIPPNRGRSKAPRELGTGRD